MSTVSNTIVNNLATCVLENENRPINIASNIINTYHSLGEYNLNKKEVDSLKSMMHSMIVVLKTNKRLGNATKDSLSLWMSDKEAWEKRISEV